MFPDPLASRGPDPSLPESATSRQLIGAPEPSPLFDDGEHREQVTVPARIERSRQFGEVDVALALWRGAGLEKQCRRLLPMGEERIAWSRMPAVLVTPRFCAPSSALHSAEDWYRRTGPCDLLQLGDAELTKDRLDREPDHLLAHKTMKCA